MSSESIAAIPPHYTPMVFAKLLGLLAKPYRFTHLQLKWVWPQVNKEEEDGNIHLLCHGSIKGGTSSRWSYLMGTSYQTDRRTPSTHLPINTADKLRKCVLWEKFLITSSTSRAWQILFFNPLKTSCVRRQALNLLSDLMWRPNNIL